MKSNVNFFLDEDSEVRCLVEKLPIGDHWIVKIGEVKYDTFHTFVTFFAETEKQARQILKAWKQEALV